MIKVFFTSGHGPYIQQFQETLEETNPLVEVVYIKAGDRAQVFNEAVAANPGKPDDVLLFCDDDIIWTGTIVPPGRFFAAKLLPRTWHSSRYNGNWLLAPCEMADGFAIGCTREVFEAVGGFDTNFKHSGFQDADFTFKALQCGIELVKWDLPGRHLGSGTKYQINPDHNRTRLDNLEYLTKKWNIPIITPEEKRIFDNQ